MIPVTYTKPEIREEVARLLALLRKRTQRDHHELDHHPVLRRLLTPGLDRHGYVEVLHALYRPQYFLEASVGAGCRELGLDPGQLSVSRAGDLARDLEALECPVPDCSGETLLPAIDISMLVGQRYVLEGARKGSVVVARQLRRTLGPGMPMSYFDAAEPESNWQQFTLQLATLLPLMDREATVRGARGMFHAFSSRLMCRR